jgi:hypothetical protein
MDMEDLDISWVQDQEKIIHVDHNYAREPISSIHLYSLFVNLNSCVDKITCDSIELDQNIDGKTILSKEKILYYIQQKKKQGSLNGKKYRLIDSLLFLVDLDPEHLQDYSHQEPTVESSQSFFKVLSVLNDTIVSESIFIFHSLNAIYLIFKEMNCIYHPVSILKKETNFGKTKKQISGNDVDANILLRKQTKRVSINTHPLQTHRHLNNHTHKQIHINHSKTKKNN